MIVDLKRLEGDKGSWQFSTVVYWAGHEWRVKGWRYWPSSETVKPPSYSAYGKFVGLVEFAGSQDDLVKAVRQAINGLEKSETSPKQKLKHSIPALVKRWKEIEDLHGEEKRNQMIGFKKVYPEVFREVYMEVWSEYKHLFENLPPGRLWPDEYLKGQAGNVLGGTRSIDEIAYDRESGIITKDDYERIQEFVGGGK